MKKIVSNIFIGLSLIGMDISYAILSTSAFLFVGLLLAKLIGLGDISWFALTSASVFVTPIYAIIFGFIGFIISMIITSFIIDHIK